jgi:hypothetical protein
MICCKFATNVPYIISRDTLNHVTILSKEPIRKEAYSTHINNVFFTILLIVVDRNTKSTK